MSCIVRIFEVLMIVWIKIKTDQTVKYEYLLKSDKFFRLLMLGVQVL